MTKLEIIEETYKYYTEDVKRRAFGNEGKCVYKNEKGDMCAFGRCMKPDADFSNVFGIDAMAKSVDVDFSLKEEYKGHNLEFWNHLQRFHDNDINWSFTGITKNGENNYEFLRTKYAV